MDTTQLIIVVLGILAGGSTIGLTVVARSRKGDTAETIQAIQAIVGPILQQMSDQADRTLAVLGPTLLPAHGAITTAQELINDDDDFLVRLITSITHSDVVVAALRQALDLGEQFTDGIPPEGEIAGGEEPPREGEPARQLPGIPEMEQAEDSAQADAVR